MTERTITLSPIEWAEIIRDAQAQALRGAALYFEREMAPPQARGVCPRRGGRHGYPWSAIEHRRPMRAQERGWS